MICFVRYAALLSFLFLPSVGEAQNGYTFKWMNIGSLHSPYSSGGAAKELDPYDNAALQFPAIDHRSGNSRAQGVWVGAKNFRDEAGRLFPYKVAHHGPTSDTTKQFFPQTIETISRLEPFPAVTVNGEPSFKPYQSVLVDKFDPNMKADMMIHVVNNNRLGIQMDQKVFGFSQEFHDNYHLIEYKFTNTGNVDADPTIELNRKLEGVYFFFISRYAIHDGASWITGNGAPWGKITMNDAVGDGHEDYGVNFRAQYAWYGYSVFQSDFNSIGGPLWSNHWASAPIPDTTGRLAAAQMAGRMYIHADKAANDANDDPLQPSTMGVVGTDNPELKVDEYNQSLMQRQYQAYMQLGRQYPHHAQVIEPSRAYDKSTRDPAQAFGRYDEGGWAIVEGFGPYTMLPGESIRLVIAEGVAGLSEKAKLAIGRAYKFSRANDFQLIPYQVNGKIVSKTKNQWALTSKDSLFQMFERARANYNSGLNIPRPPSPPKTFTVSSDTDRIVLTWQTYPGAAQTGWEIYRAEGQHQNPNSYSLIATLPQQARRYEDTQAQKDVRYYYYLQAVGAINNNATGLTPAGVRLRSGRYYTQTYVPAVLGPPTSVEHNAAAEPSQFLLHQNYPNPFNPATVIRYQLPQANKVELTVHSLLGEVVKVLVNERKYAGAHEALWDGRDATGKLMANGIYWYRLQAGDFVETKKMLLLR